MNIWSKSCSRCSMTCPVCMVTAMSCFSISSHMSVGPNTIASVWCVIRFERLCFTTLQQQQKHASCDVTAMQNGDRKSCVYLFRCASRSYKVSRFDGGIVLTKLRNNFVFGDLSLPAIQSTIKTIWGLQLLLDQSTLLWEVTH